VSVTEGGSALDVIQLAETAGLGRCRFRWDRMFHTKIDGSKVSSGRYPKPNFFWVSINECCMAGSLLVGRLGINV
jgi:hypothetical protein